MVLETAAALAVPWLGRRFAGRVVTGRRRGLAVDIAEPARRFRNSGGPQVRERLSAHPCKRAHSSSASMITCRRCRCNSFKSERRAIFPPSSPARFRNSAASSRDHRFASSPWGWPWQARSRRWREPTGCWRRSSPFRFLHFFLALKVIGRRLRSLSMRIQEEEATSITIAEENLGMLPIIKPRTDGVASLQRADSPGHAAQRDAEPQISILRVGSNRSAGSAVSRA
jgi:hypothetical protein